MERLTVSVGIFFNFFFGFVVDFGIGMSFVHQILIKFDFIVGWILKLIFDLNRKLLNSFTFNAHINWDFNQIHTSISFQ